MKYTLQAKSPADIGALLQEGQDRWLQVTKRWLEILTLDPSPQTGCSPKDVIWRKNKAKLYRYHHTVLRRYKTPVLFLYALINRAYILDITPGMSMVEYLVNEGFDVYMLEWGDFDWEDRKLSFAELIYDYIARAVRRVAVESESEEISLIGYCMGGTMATMYAALFEQPKIRNLVYIASPLDFSNAGISSIWLAAPAFNPDRVADTFQLIPRDFIDMGTKMLNPVNNYLGTYTRLWRLLDEGLSVHAWKVLNKWMNDGINFPGEAYRQWIKEFYQENRLIKNQIVLRGRTVHLQRIKSNLLALVGERDHIVLPDQTAAALEYLGSKEKSYYEFPVGHGGLVFGSVARDQVFPLLANWLRERSEGM